MDPELAAVTNRYLEHLSEVDLALIVRGRDAKPTPPDEPRARLREQGRILELLGQPELVAQLLGAHRDERRLIGASPFLLFAVAIERVTQDLASALYVNEWLGLRQRAPVFDVAPLRHFLNASRRRLFLAELLASYTKVASGSMLVPTRRGLRRQRFSELDPVRLASLIDHVDPSERPGVLRRLGDLALFLTGVFPDQVARRGFGPVDEQRLRRSAGVGVGTPAAGHPPAPAPFDGGAVSLLEMLGRRWYGAAFDLLPRPAPVTSAVLGEMGELFGEARRILNFLTERYLFPERDRLFGLGSA